MPRFYCPDAVFTLHEKCVLPEKARHHAGRVLRMKAGETAVLFDGKGAEASGPIAFEGKDGYIVVEEIRHPANESPVRMRLVQALVSPEKTDWIIEKADPLQSLQASAFKSALPNAPTLPRRQPSSAVAP